MSIKIQAQIQLLQFVDNQYSNLNCHKLYYLYDLAVKDDSLDVVGSYLIIYNLADLLKSNPQANANLITFENNPKNVYVLSQIRAFLLSRGISPGRIKVIPQPYRLTAENSDPKSAFGWQYIQN